MRIYNIFKKIFMYNINLMYLMNLPCRLKKNIYIYTHTIIHIIYTYIYTLL